MLKYLGGGGVVILALGEAVNSVPINKYYAM